MIAIWGDGFFMDRRSGGDHQFVGLGFRNAQPATRKVFRRPNMFLAVSPSVVGSGDNVGRV